jgi:hypothetical protein
MNLLPNGSEMLRRVLQGRLVRRTLQHNQEARKLFFCQRAKPDSV